MSGKQFRIVLVEVVIAGLLGGMLSDRLLQSALSPAGAEIVPLRPEPGKETLVAHRLLIIDEEGNTRASLDGWGLRFDDPKSAAGVSLLLGDGDTVLPRFTLSNGEEALGGVGASVSPKGLASLRLGQQGGQSIECQVDSSRAAV